MRPSRSTPPDAVPLAQLARGRCARVSKILGGRELSRRLMGLGIRVGSEIAVLHHRGRGVVLAAGSNRIALGGGIADKLLVVPLESELPEGLADAPGPGPGSRAPC